MAKKTKEQKQQERAERSERNSDTNALIGYQRLELDAMKAGGATKEQMAAEKKANTQELKDYKKNWSSSDDVDYRTANSTYQDDAGLLASVNEIGDRTQEFMSSNKLGNRTINGSKEEGTTVQGFSVRGIGNQLAGYDGADKKYEWAGNVVDTIQSGLSEDQVEKLREVKGYDNLYRLVIAQNGEDNITGYYTKDSDGNYKSVTFDSYVYQAPKVEQSGLGIGGQIIGAVVTLATGNPILGGSIGGFLSTGDIEGAITGGFTGWVGGQLGQTGFVRDLANSTSSLTGLSTDVTSRAITSSITSGVRTAINGGDFSTVLENSLISGIASGAGTYVGEQVNDYMMNETYGVDSEQSPAPVDNKDISNDATIDEKIGAYTGVNTVTDAASGAVTGLINAVGHGVDPLTGLVVGAGSGLVAGAADDFGISTDISNVIGNGSSVIIGDSMRDNNNEDDTTLPRSGGGSNSNNTTNAGSGVGYADMGNPESISFRDLRNGRNINWTQRRA